MSPQLYTYVRSFNKFIGQHHAVIFISALCLTVGIAVLSLYQVLNISSDSTNTASTSTIQGFDTETADKIKQLRISSETGDSLQFPSPRTTPFAE